MFELAAEARRGTMPGYTAISLGVHGALVAVFVLAATLKSQAPVEKMVEVSFVGPGKTAGAPPPPPPPAKKHSSAYRKQRLPTRIEIPKVVEMPKLVEPPQAEAEPEEEEDDGAEEGGVEGGVKGGVVGGVLNGTVGGTGGGGSMVPAPPKDEPIKAKNVPPFVIQRDALQQPKPRLTEVFIRSHFGRGDIAGMYKVCVGKDGHVYDVIPVKNIPGADEEIIDGIKGGWLYRPQQVPVCFLYNIPIILQ